MKTDLKEKKTALKKAEKEMASLGAKRASCTSRPAKKDVSKQLHANPKAELWMLIRD